MLSKEIENIILNLKDSFLYSEGIPERLTKSCYYIAEHTKEDLNKLFKYIEQLETDNKNLNMILEEGLNKEKQYCFNEDGNTEKCLGHGNDEPCDYCKSCKKINIKEFD